MKCFELLAIACALLLFIASCGATGAETAQAEKTEPPTETVSTVTTSPATKNAPASSSQPEKQPSFLDNATIGEKNAYHSALSYLSFSSFSYKKLIEQLEYEKYSHEEAVFAADHCGADWREQAVNSAEDYLSFSAFSQSKLIEQLEYEGFSTDDAEYAVQHCNADWKEQAAKSAEGYLSFSSFSKDRLIEQLKYEGFSQEEAEYGVAQVGY